MKTKILIFLLCLASLSVMGQGTITRQSTRKTEPKKQMTEQPAKQNSNQKQKTEQSSKQNSGKKVTNSQQRQNSKPLSLPTEYVNGHGYVDLGLSVKWATCNVGASSPSDYGGYYAWGETKTKTSYEWDNCFDFVQSNNWYSDSAWHIYKLGGQSRITPTSGHDTARENWGSTWRMPTDAEIDELINKCEWTWTTKNGHNGYTVTGPNGNNIFLPAAGCRNVTSFVSVGKLGNYWSSIHSSIYSYSAISLEFYSSRPSTNFTAGRRIGSSVRPVTE